MRLLKRYRAIGLMSGTSLDGLDIAYCEFVFKKQWSFRVMNGSTLPYSKTWRRQLADAHTLAASGLLELNMAYGKFLGNCVNEFITKNKIKAVDLIASHGHTIFHQPENGFTFQLGDGSALHAEIDIPVVYDFRSMDVALGGEGAPLVPMGDQELFSSYQACLNLGGIANISMDVRGRRKAFDICFCNMTLNHIIGKTGKDFDKDGKTAAGGKVLPKVLESLQEIYADLRKERPSIGRELFEKKIQPILDEGGASVPDMLRTVCEGIAIEVGVSLPKTGRLSMLTTGGGALNKFLVEMIRQKLPDRVKVVVPSRETIEFKEALIFAFLGVLRLRNEINVLGSVTRARRDSCSGVVVGL